MAEEKVIILNKSFLGDWLDTQGHIGHEIIDFLLTDNGEYYVYNNPWGACPDDIWVEDTEQFNRTKKEKYIAKYLVLTGQGRNNFEILYVIELEEKLHREHIKKERDTAEFKKIQGKIKEIIRNKNIKYNGKYLDEIYLNDDSLYVTFKGKKVYKAKSPISIEGLDYNFQRNKGYLYSDKYAADYYRMEKIINNCISNGSLEEFTPRSVNVQQIGEINEKKTFLDLIGLESNEQVFTNILYSLLNQNGLFKRFCETFKGDKYFDSQNEFQLFRETKIVAGRMDVCGESDRQRVIIENKVNSGLNGVKPADSTTQLSTYYYQWGIAKPLAPLCFIVVPNYRMAEVIREISRRDPEMSKIYQIISYYDIVTFLKKEQNNISETYEYYSLLPQIISAFKNLAYLTKEDLYAKMFLNATN